MRLKILALLVPLVFVADQLTKRLIVHFVPLGSSLPVLPGFFDIVHTRNRGAAFGLLRDLPDSFRLPFFFIISTLALLSITVYFFKLKETRKGPTVGLALILGGALGNIWDRIFLGEVIDFLSLHWREQVIRWNVGGIRLHLKLEWPAFNLADACITVAILGLMLLMARPKKEKGETQ